MTPRRLATAFRALLAALVLSGAGPYTGRLTETDLRHVRTIAIIPALGASFQFERIRDAPLEWVGPPDSHFLEISDWNLDARIAHDVTAALGARFTVKPIAFVPANFMSWNDSILQRASLDLNGDPSIDAYVLILRDWRPDEIGYSAHDLGGLGFYRRDEPGRPAKFGVFACYRIVVVDALTGDIIASRAALTRDGALPWLAIDPSLWPKTPNDLTDGQKDALLRDETSLIEGTLRLTLEKMNLAR